LDSMSRKPQCPVTCQGAVIRPPRPGAPSCGTRHLGSVRSVLAKQVGYQTSFSLSSAAGSRELSGASPSCGMASVAGCGLIEPSLTLHRLRPYRSSNRTALRDPRSGYMPVPRPPTTLGRGDNWTMAGRPLPPYRSRASPTRKLPAFTNFARATAIARPQAAHNSYNAIVLHVWHEQPAQKANDPQCPSPTRRPFRESALVDKVMTNNNRPSGADQ
jgi:hypothetical protein